MKDEKNESQWVCGSVDSICSLRAPVGKSWNQWRILDEWILRPDLICSLGGDCIAAAQIKVRGLRPFSLPFDWCSSNGAPAIENLAHQFEQGFTGFARRENMEPLPGIRFGYRDKFTGFGFIHHFKSEISQPGEFERFDAVLQRRLRRLRTAIESSSSVLFLVSRIFEIEEKCLWKMDEVCSRLWPQKKFQYALLTYNSRSAEVRHTEKFAVIRLLRDRTSYDMHEKVFEWSFLDGIQYSESAKRMHVALRDGGER